MPSPMATFVHPSRNVFYLAQPWAVLRTRAFCGFPTLAVALISFLILSDGCGSSASTTVAAPSAAISSRCQANVSSSAPKFASGGGTGTLSVNVDRDCTWNATSQVAWIAITSTPSGQGDGPIGLRVTANG